jgi:DNA-directed RNA polymerase subunit M/transcription elongation factor TFIIS
LNSFSSDKKRCSIELLLHFYKNSNKTDEVEEHNNPKRKVIAVDLQRVLFNGYNVAKKMKNDENKNDIAPSNRITCKVCGSSELNFRITMLKLASDPGRVALFIGSMRLLRN